MKLIKLAIIALVCITSIAQAQNFKTNKPGSTYQFSPIRVMETGPVADQGNTGTCWSFSSCSFFESELIRLGKGKHNLSEMYIARQAYTGKTNRYVRVHGNTSWGQGGLFHDAPYVLKNYGFLPEEVYTGKPNNEAKFNHSELEEVLGAVIKAIVKQPNSQGLSESWSKAISGILDAYLGIIPANFSYQGKQHTPQSFTASLGLVADDYVQISSFTHHPLYSQFVLEVPDNWMQGSVYNVGLDEFGQTIESALTNGYTVAWAADVSEPYFSHKSGLAVVPESLAEVAGAEKEKMFVEPIKEKQITAALRQTAYDNYQTQDDHGMHIVGLFKDQTGNKFYLVKNSWGTSKNECGGFLYVSHAYLLYKTTCIMIHKNAVPKAIAKKLKL